MIITIETVKVDWATSLRAHLPRPINSYLANAVHFAELDEYIFVRMKDYRHPWR